MVSVGAGAGLRSALVRQWRDCGEYRVRAGTAARSAARARNEIRAGARAAQCGAHSRFGPARLRRSALRDTASGAAASAVARATLRAGPALRDRAAMAASATRPHGGGAVGAPAGRPAYSRLPGNLRTASPDTVGRLWCGRRPDITGNVPVSGRPGIFAVKL